MKQPNPQETTLPEREKLVDAVCQKAANIYLSPSDDAAQLLVDQIREMLTVETQAWTMERNCDLARIIDSTGSIVASTYATDAEKIVASHNRSGSKARSSANRQLLWALGKIIEMDDAQSLTQEDIERGRTALSIAKGEAWADAHADAVPPEGRKTRQKTERELLGEPADSMANYTLTIIADSGYQSTTEGRCNADQYSTAMGVFHGHAISTKWQPIKTAPRDGTLFIGWVAAERRFDMNDGKGTGFIHDFSQADFCWWQRVKSSPEGGFFDTSCGEIGDAQHVTHWMEVPEKPTDTSKEST